MKKTIVALLTIAMLLATASARAEVNADIQLQQDQIVSDAQSGRISQANAKKLLQHLDRIKAELKRAKSDGHVNVYENQKITQMLSENTSALQIYRQRK